MSEYESVLLVKKEVFVYRIPPRQSNRGYRAADWKLDAPDWTGRMRMVAVGEQLTVKLEDRNTGDLFAKCPVESYPSVAIESVLDSSRYFVIRLVGDDGRTAFIGIGFQDRGDSFDFNVAIQDHFKHVQQERDAAKASMELNTGPKLDLGFKEGQTIKIQLNTKRSGDEGAAKARPRVSKPAGAGGILLPPPPSASSRGQPRIVPPAPPASTGSSGGTSNVDLLGGLAAPAAAAPVASQPAADDWMNF